jgi:hypothetical protein
MISCLSAARSTDVRLPPGPPDSRRPQTRFTPVRPGTSSRDVHVCAARAGATRLHVNITAVHAGRRGPTIRFGVARAGTLLERCFQPREGVFRYDGIITLRTQH